MIILPRVVAWIRRQVADVVDDIPNPDLAAYARGVAFFRPVVVVGRINERRFLMPRPPEVQ